MSKIRETVDAVKAENSRAEVQGEVVVFPSGLALMDSFIGGGLRQGHLAGDIVRIVGPSKVGKTYLVMETIAACYHKWGDKFKWVLDCVEGGFSFWNAMDLWGLPIKPENIITSNTPRESYYAIDKFYRELKDDEYGIAAMDSLDGFLGDQQLEKLAIEIAVHEGTSKKKVPGQLRAEVPTYMSSTYFPMISKYLNSTSETKKNALFMFISQLRDNPAMPNAGKKPSGGNAAIFYPDTRIDLWRAQELTRKDDIFGEDRVVGSVVRAFLEKTRTPRPERHMYYTYWTGNGLQEIETNIDYIYGLRADVGQKMQWGQVKGGEKMAKVIWKDETVTRQKLIRMAEEDPKVDLELRKMAQEVWEKVEVSVASTRRRKYS